MSHLIGRAAAILVAAAVGCGGASQPGESAGALSAEDLQKPWIELPVPHALEAPHLARGSSGFLAVAREIVGGKAISAVYNYLYRSDDGVRWQRLPLDVRFDEFFGFRGLAQGDGKYVMAGSWAMKNALWTSSDGQQWSRQSFEIGISNLAAVTYTNNRFFAMSTGREVFTSTDGQRWQMVSLDTLQAQAVAFGNGRYVLGGSGPLQLSDDGVTWRAKALDCALPGACISDPSGGIHQAYHSSVVFAEGRFYVGELSSSDGATWQPHGDPIPVAYAGGYLFAHAVVDQQKVLRAWKPGTPAVTVDVQRPTAPVALAEGSAPETIDTRPPTGETCLTHRCLIIDGALYLLR